MIDAIIFVASIIGCSFALVYNMWISKHYAGLHRLNTYKLINHIGFNSLLLMFSGFGIMKCIIELVKICIK